MTIDDFPTPKQLTSIEKPPGFSIEVEQPQKGYRYNQDPFHLVEFVREHSEIWHTQLKGTCLDIGCGVGIIPLLLTKALPDTSFTGVEIQPELAELARSNTRLNDLNKKISIKNMDYRALSKEKKFTEHFQWIICNPPYYAENSGRKNACPQKKIARHEITTNLESLTQSAAHLLNNRGLFIVIFPAERLLELTSSLQKVKLEPKVIKFIHPKTSDCAAMVLIAARKNGAPGVKIENPMII